MVEQKQEKSLWDYLLVISSVIITFGQILAVFTQGEEYLSKPFGIVVIVSIVSIGLIIACIIILQRKKKPDMFVSKGTPYYSTKLRKIARIGLLVTPTLLFLLLAIFIYKQVSCRFNVEEFPKNSFGILIADFTEGPDRHKTMEGQELADRTLMELRTRLNLATRSIENTVFLQRTCEIKNEQDALEIGLAKNATLVIWGNMAEFSENIFTPTFTPTRYLILPTTETFDTFDYEYEFIMGRDELPIAFSTQSAAVASYILGYIYLTETNDYESAINEFTYALDNTLSLLSEAKPHSNQELLLKRALAKLYTLRGRTYAVLGKNNKILSEYNEAVKYDDTYYGTYIGIGNYYYSMYEYAKAEDAYREALIRKKSPNAFYSLGNALSYQDGKHDECIKSYLEAIRLMELIDQDPSNVRLILASVYYEHGDSESAKKQLQLVLNSEGKNIDLRERSEAYLATVLAPTPPRVTAVPLIPRPTVTQRATTVATMTPTTTPTQRPTSEPATSQSPDVLYITNPQNSTNLNCEMNEDCIIPVTVQWISDNQATTQGLYLSVWIKPHPGNSLYLFYSQTRVIYLGNGLWQSFPVYLGQQYDEPGTPFAIYAIVTNLAYASNMQVSSLPPHSREFIIEITR